MKKINIYIARRNRQEHLENCLHYLNEANSKNKYQVSVYVNSDTDTDEWSDPRNYQNLILSQSWNTKNRSPLFNKSKLLNECILVGGCKGADWFSIVDVDMIYPPNWFELMETKLEDWDYVVCHGWKLNKDTQLEVNKRPTFEILSNLPKTEFSVGPSQVTMTTKCLKIFVDVFGWPLYDEKFEGWGGEDSILSSMSRKLQREEIIRKIEIPKIWLHQWHEDVKPLEKNQEYFKTRDAEIMSWK